MSDTRQHDWIIILTGLGIILTVIFGFWGMITTVQSMDAKFDAQGQRMDTFMAKTFDEFKEIRKDMQDEFKEIRKDMQDEFRIIHKRLDMNQNNTGK